MKTIAFGIFSGLFLTSILMFPFNVASGFPELLVHNIDTGLDYATIQEAIDANETLNGQTIYVEEGIHYENLVVSKSLSLIGEKTENTIINGIRSDDVVHVKADNVTIAHFTIRNSSRRFYVSGIRIDASDHCNVTGNRLIDNMYGILINHGSDIAIIGNDLIGNSWIGLGLNESFSNTISENQIVANKGGIELEASAGNSIHKNNIVNNTVAGIRQTNSPYNTIYWNNITTNSLQNAFGIWLSDSSNNNISRNTFESCGMIVADSYDNTVENNVVNNKPLVYLEGASNCTVQEAGQVIAINCNEICVKNLNLSWATVGVELWGTNNSEIANNSIFRNSFGGVVLEDSCHNHIYRNNITENSDAIRFAWFQRSSNGNTISENNVVGNEYGIYLGYSSNNNTIARNKIEQSRWHGIYVYSSRFNVISMNSISANTPGLYFTDSSNNLVFDNNFVNNSAQVYTGGSVNTWDNNYEGNYWSDYRERYPNAMEIDEMGIWDTPYVIDENNTDHYPLVNPWLLIPSVVEASVDVHPETLNLRSKGKWITAHIGLPEDYDVSGLDVSAILMNDTIPVEKHTIKNGHLMVKFSRSPVISLVSEQPNNRNNRCYVALTITGSLSNGTLFQGSDQVGIMMSSQQDWNGERFPPNNPMQRR